MINALHGIGVGGDDDDDQDGDLVEAQQALFAMWDYDYDAQAATRITGSYVHDFGALEPNAIKAWVKQASLYELNQLCQELRSVREQSLRDNFEMVQAQLRCAKLTHENARLRSELLGQDWASANSQNLTLTLGSIWTGKCDDFYLKIKDLSYWDRTGPRRTRRI